MPKAKRLNVPFDLAKEIWEGLLQKVPWNKNNLNKTQYFDELSKQCGQKASSIQQYLFEPLNKQDETKAILLSLESINLYCDFLSNKELKNRILAFCSAEENDIEMEVSLNDIQDKIWTKEIPKYFVNTSWYNYERHDRGLSRDIITIHGKNQEGFYTAELKIHERNHESYLGIVTLDNSRNYLIINFVTIETAQKYLHLLIRIGNGTKPVLCIGHDSYISTHHQKILTKSVIWAKIEGENKAEPKFLRYDSEDYQSLHWTIKRYLKENRMNRLTSPRRAITDEIEFEN